MTAGAIVPLTLAERAQRLEGLYSIEVGSSLPALYSLKRGETGGRDPSAVHPFATRDKDGRHTADCTGVALWGQGIDRFQPKRFPIYGGWVNTDSMLIDALGEFAVTGAGAARPKTALFRVVFGAPQPGHLVVYPAVFDRGTKLRGSIGHVLTIVELDPAFPEWAGLSLAAPYIKVVHCHGGREGRTKRAVERVTLRAAIGASVKRAHVLEMCPGA